MQTPRLKLKRETRRRRHQSAWINLHGSQIECSLTNLSHRGAQIVVDADLEVPHRFALSLVPDIPNTKSCEVIWRQGKTMGIKFID
jgi:hypothetical protein